MTPHTFIPTSMERSFLKILKSDDAEALRNILLEFNTIDLYFSHSFYTGDVVYSSSPPVVSVAAYFGAEECLNYLIMNGCDLAVKDSLGNAISHFAVAGGSLDIVNILNNNCVLFDTNDLYVAADSGNFEMFMWIYTTQIVDILKRKEDRTCLLHHAVKGKSWKLIQFLLKQLESILDVNDLLEVTSMINSSTEDFLSEEDDEYDDICDTSSNRITFQVEENEDSLSM